MSNWSTRLFPRPDGGGDSPASMQPPQPHVFIGMSPTQALPPSSAFPTSAAAVGFPKRQSDPDVAASPTTAAGGAEGEARDIAAAARAVWGNSGDAAGDAAAPAEPRHTPTTLPPTAPPRASSSFVVSAGQSPWIAPAMPGGTARGVSPLSTGSPFAPGPTGVYPVLPPRGYVAPSPSVTPPHGPSMPSAGMGGGLMVPPFHVHGGYGADHHHHHHHHHGHHGAPHHSPATAPAHNGPIWVLDPMTRKLRVPVDRIVPTQATHQHGSVPSLCIPFLEGKCHTSRCRQAHVPLDVVTQLREEAQNVPSCCIAHGSPFDTAFFTSRFKGLVVLLGPQQVPSGVRYRDKGADLAAAMANDPNAFFVPADRVALSVGLQRHCAQQVPVGFDDVVIEIPMRHVCRLHVGHRCRYIEDCNNYHICRDLGRQLLQQMGSTPPLAHATPPFGHQSPHQQQQQHHGGTTGQHHSESRFSVSTSRASANPRWTPPMVSMALPPAEAGPSAEALPPPAVSGACASQSSHGAATNFNASTTAVDPDDASASPMAMNPNGVSFHGTATAAGFTHAEIESLRHLRPHLPSTQLGGADGATFTVRTLRVGAVSDEEFASIVDATAAAGERGPSVSGGANGSSAAGTARAPGRGTSTTGTPLNGNATPFHQAHPPIALPPATVVDFCGTGVPLPVSAAARARSSPQNGFPPPPAGGSFSQYHAQHEAQAAHHHHHHHHHHHGGGHHQHSHGFTSFAGPAAGGDGEWHISSGSMAAAPGALPPPPPPSYVDTLARITSPTVVPSAVVGVEGGIFTPNRATPLLQFQDPAVGGGGASASTSRMASPTASFALPPFALGASVHQHHHQHHANARPGTQLPHASLQIAASVAAAVHASVGRASLPSAAASARKRTRSHGPGEFTPGLHAAAPTGLVFEPTLAAPSGTGGGGLGAIGSGSGVTAEVDPFRLVDDVLGDQD